MSTVRVLGSLMFVCVFAAGTRANLIANGSFETPILPSGYELLPGADTISIASWTTIHQGVERFAPSTSSLNGDACDELLIVDLNPDIGPPGGGIEQTVTTVVDQWYLVTFCFGTVAAGGRDGTAQINVSAALGSQTFNASNLTGTIVWTTRTFTFKATSATSTVRFEYLGPISTHFAFIDDVTMNPTVAQPVCPGDANGDGVVNFHDITVVLANFGTSWR